MDNTETIIKTLEVMSGEDTFNGRFAIDYMRDNSRNLDFYITHADKTQGTFVIRSEYMGLDFNTVVTNLAARDEMYLDSILKSHVIRMGFNLFYVNARS